MSAFTHLRRNAVAYVALFAALTTGSAYAAGQVKSKDIAKDAVRAKHLKGGQVRAAELGANAVSGAKVADDSLTGADIDESTLRLPPAPAQPAPQPQPQTPAAQQPPPDLSGFPEVIAAGYLSGAGPLSTADRCNSVGTEAPGAQYGDHVVVTAPSLLEEVVFTGTVSPDFVAYQACYAGAANVTLSGDVRYMVLRRQAP